MSRSNSSFPLNAWYASAYDVEIKHSLLARTICKQKLVLYRRSNGQVAALEDACWHRLMPLSLGRLEGDELVCGYHGLVYNAQGRCTHMPSQETLNPSACVRNFPVVERHRFVWIWAGDPARRANAACATCDIRRRARTRTRPSGNNRAARPAYAGAATR